MNYTLNNRYCFKKLKISQKIQSFFAITLRIFVINVLSFDKFVKIEIIHKFTKFDVD